MIGPFAEAVRASTQPCTFLLVVPAVVAVVAARARWSSLVTVLVAAVVGGWWFASNAFVLDGWLLRLTGVAVIALLGIVVVGDRRPDATVLSDEWVAAAVAGIVTLIATQWWRPCVGAELGAILTDAQDGLAGQLPAMAAYMLGAMVPAAVVVLAVQVLQPSARVLDVGALGALAIGVVVAGALALGQHEEVVITLTRWTLE